MNKVTMFLIMGFALLFNACKDDDDVVLQPTNELEVFAELDQAAGNIAFTNTGQLVFSYHPFYDPEIRVASYNETTKTVSPFPNLDWNTVKTDSEDYLDNVLGVRNDSEGTIWMLDMGTRNDITPKLVGWNTITNQLERNYPMPAPITLNTSQPQDLVIDNTHGVFVIADEDIGRGGSGLKGALIVIDKATGDSRRVLQGHYSTRADTTKAIVVDGKILGDPIYVGVDGITLDKNNEWLYYAPLNGSKVYRLKMTDLLNESLSDEELGQLVETYSDKENNGGISIDVDDNLYLTNIESHSVGFVSSNDQNLSILTSTVDMQWPDGVSYNKDGYMYISASQIHLGAAFNNGTDLTIKPYKIFRFKPVAEGIFGR